MPRQLGQEPLVEGALALDAVAEQPAVFVSMEVKTGKWGEIVVVQRRDLWNNEDLAPIATGAKSTAFGQFRKEAMEDGDVFRIHAQEAKKSKNTVYIVEVFTDHEVEVLRSQPRVEPTPAPNTPNGGA